MEDNGSDSEGSNADPVGDESKDEEDYSLDDSNKNALDDDKVTVLQDMDEFNPHV